MLKKIFGLSLVAIGIACGYGAYSDACTPYSHEFTQCDAIGSNNDIYQTPNPAGGANGIWVLNGATHRNVAATMGSGLTWSGGVIDVAPQAPAAPTINNGVSRPINSTAFQPSTTKTTHGVYSITIASSLSLTGGQDGTMFFEVSANGSTGWTEVGRVRNGNTGTLTIGLNTVQTQTYQLSGQIPAGYYGRIRTANNTGTPTFTYVTGQETLW